MTDLKWMRLWCISKSALTLTSVSHNDDLRTFNCRFLPQVRWNSASDLINQTLRKQGNVTLCLNLNHYSLYLSSTFSPSAVNAPPFTHGLFWRHVADVLSGMYPFPLLFVTAVTKLIHSICLQFSMACISSTGMFNSSMVYYISYLMTSSLD